MKCPGCGSSTKVIETRGIRRRRECLACLHRFTTKEHIVQHYQRFYREKVN